MILNMRGILLSASLAALFMRGADATDWSLRELRRSIMTLLDKQDIRSRILEMTPQCEADMQLLNSNQALLNAQDALEAEFLAEPSCTGMCAFDFKEYSAYPTFVTACEKAGGDLYLITDEINCSGSDATHTYSLDIKFINEPLCIAPSCDISDFIESVDAEVDALAQAREDLETSVSNYKCSSPNSIVSGPAGRADETTSAAFDLHMMVPLVTASTMVILTWFTF